MQWVRPSGLGWLEGVRGVGLRLGVGVALMGWGGAGAWVGCSETGQGGLG